MSYGARRQSKWVDRDNLMVKVPATPAGIPAIRQLTAEGISINVTLLFSQSVYEEVARAFIAGLQDFYRRHEGRGIWCAERALPPDPETLAEARQAHADGEIGDAQWFHRDEVRAALARGDGWSRAEAPGSDDADRLRLPGSISIARSMIEAWAASSP